MIHNPPRRVRPLTPKEFSEAIHGLLCADTVRAWCARGDIQTIRGPGRPPYLIPATELERFCPVVGRFLVAA